MRRSKARIGDVFEIFTPAGLAYVQYTHDGKSMAQLVRILPGLFAVRPHNFEELAKQRELYFVFYTLEYAIRANDVEVVSHQPVPQWAQPDPIMRWGLPDFHGGKILAWKFFRASDELTVENHLRAPVAPTLTPEQEKLSIHELWSHQVLVREIARGWLPEKAEEFRLQDAEAGENEKDLPRESASAEAGMQHFLYFPRKRDAEAAARELRSRGYSVKVSKGADEQSWLTLAVKAVPQDRAEMDEVRDEMEFLAKQFGGEYDGWETAVDLLGSSTSDDETVN